MNDNNFCKNSITSEKSWQSYSSFLYWLWKVSINQVESKMKGVTYVWSDCFCKTTQRVVETDSAREERIAKITQRSL